MEGRGCLILCTQKGGGEDDGRQVISGVWGERGKSRRETVSGEHRFLNQEPRRWRCRSCADIGDMDVKVMEGSGG